MKRWSVTQTGNITMQLNAGIRYLDIRALWNRDRWVIHHALEGDNITQVFNEIKTFMDNNIYEVLWIDVCHTEFSAPGYNNSELLTLITSIVGDYAITNNTILYKKTFKEYWKENKRIILTFDVKEDAYKNNKFFFKDDILDGRFANTAYVNNMIEHNNYQLNNRTNNKMLQIFFTITPSIETVLCSMLPGRPLSLLEFSILANQEIKKWIDKNIGIINGTIITVDNYEESESLIKSAIKIANL